MNTTSEWAKKYAAGRPTRRTVSVDRIRAMMNDRIFRYRVLEQYYRDENVTRETALRHEIFLLAELAGVSRDKARAEMWRALTDDDRRRIRNGEVTE